MDFEQTDAREVRRIRIQRELPSEINIRTSGRTLFKKCRRLWGWTTSFKGNLEVNIRPIYFWFGTGMHFALEDFHGNNYYEHPAAAFLAYYEATKQAKLAPPEAREMMPLALGMMVYYKDYWLEQDGREKLDVLYVDGVPQAEVRFRIPLPIEGPQGQKVFYQGTFDGIMEDEHGRLWIKEYKSAKNFVTGHFDTDTQITSYCWAAQTIYGRPVAGVMYQQHKKAFPSPPKLLKTGKVSTSKNMSTTPRMYAHALKETYGSIEVAPTECRAYLNGLIKGSNGDDFWAADKFIRQDYIYRNQFQIAAEGEKILLEVEEMLREGLPLYPTPTRDCSWQCPLESACIAMDDGSDYESLLLSLTHEREEESEEWRTLLPLEIPQIPEYSKRLAPLEVPEEELQQETPKDPQQGLLDLLELDW